MARIFLVKARSKIMLTEAKHFSPCTINQNEMCCAKRWCNSMFYEGNRITILHDRFIFGLVWKIIVKRRIDFDQE